MVTLLIPAAVVRHWQPKFDDLAVHGQVQASDVTYAKVLAATGRRAVIDADASDLAEIVAECDFALTTDNEEVAETSGLRSAYRKLLTAAKTAQAAA